MNSHDDKAASGEVYSRSWTRPGPWLHFGVIKRFYSNLDMLIYDTKPLKKRTIHVTKVLNSFYDFRILT